MNDLSQFRMQPDTDMAQVVEELTQRLAQVERLVGELTGELTWSQERLVTELYDRVAAQTEAEHSAQADAATGLANRRALEQRIAFALRGHAADGQAAAVIALGVPRLAELRASLGFAAEDRVLRTIADRLRRALRGTDLVARIGDHQFALLLQHLRQPEDAGTVAAKLHDAIDAPLAIGDRELRLTPVVGVALYPQDGDSADALLSHAGAALAFAREGGDARCQFYRADLAERSVRRMTLETELHAALERDQFRVLYQPRFDAKSGRMLGVEALLRWQHPERGLLAPAEFLQAAEDSGLMVPIGRHVLQQACSAAAGWNRGGHGLAVSVNLSAREFRGPRLQALVAEALAASALAPDCLQIELAEASLDGAAAALPALQALRAQGVRIGLDGFSSAALALLRHWPVDCVKLDGEFSRRAQTDRCDALIAAAVANVGRRLGLRVVAAGVESEAQLALVKKLRCHEVQGFLLGEPVPVDSVSLWLAGQAPVRRRPARRRPAGPATS